MPIEKPNDDLSKQDLNVLFEDGCVARNVTDVWIRQDGRWINLIPPDRIYKNHKYTISDKEGRFLNMEIKQNERTYTLTMSETERKELLWAFSGNSSPPAVGFRKLLEEVNTV